MPYEIPRFEAVPLDNHEVSLRVDGVERTRWNFGPDYPRPHFFPFNGPSGESLTRMGHPGAPDHDHHQSIWFAHTHVGPDETNFWSYARSNRIEQKQWYSYVDGPDEAVMSSLLGWFDEQGKELMEQDLVAALTVPPDNEKETLLEIQSTFRPIGTDSLTLGKTNFGFLAIRVAKSLSAHFGGGQLTNSAGQKGEPAIFGQMTEWMDYTGPVVTGAGSNRKLVTEGITYFDHPGNPRFPNHWHVRADGWMGCSPCMHEPITLTESQPLTLRFLFHAHEGDLNPARARSLATAFGNRPSFSIGKGTLKHHQYETKRLDAAG